MINTYAEFEVWISSLIKYKPLYTLFCDIAMYSGNKLYQYNGEYIGKYEILTLMIKWLDDNNALMNLMPFWYNYENIIRTQSINYFFDDLLECMNKHGFGGYANFSRELTFQETLNIIMKKPISYQEYAKLSDELLEVL
jgi:hypothetical protein